MLVNKVFSYIINTLARKKPQKTDGWCRSIGGDAGVDTCWVEFASLRLIRRLLSATAAAAMACLSVSLKRALSSRDIQPPSGYGHDDWAAATRKAWHTHARTHIQSRVGFSVTTSRIDCNIARARDAITAMLVIGTLQTCWPVVSHALYRTALIHRIKCWRTTLFTTVANHLCYGSDVK